MQLDPDIRRFYDAAAQEGRSRLSDGTPAQARAVLRAGRAALGQGPQLPDVRNLTIPTRSGALDARIYLPRGRIKALVVYFHGGGWVIGEADDYDACIRTLCARSNCVYLVPEYRLAPEHPFPRSLEDAQDVVVWAEKHAEQLAGEDVPLILAGDSAGGNLATVTCHLLRGKVAIAGSLLIVPVTDSRMETSSYQTYADGFGLTRRDMEWFFGHYAPPDIRGDQRISPLRQTEIDNFPPTVVVTAECDVLRDEGEAYAARLRDLGASVRVRREPGMPHGFVRLHNISPAADAAVSRLADEIVTFARSSRKAKRDA